MRGLPILESLSFAEERACLTGVSGHLVGGRQRMKGQVHGARHFLSPADQHPAAASKPPDESKKTSATNAADGVAHSMFENSQ